MNDIHHLLILNYEEVEIDEDHQQLYDEMPFLNLIMNLREEKEVVAEVEEEPMEGYQLAYFHLLLIHFSFRLNLLLMMLNEDMDRHDAKIDIHFYFILTNNPMSKF
jgi:hypothetical protein